jgi:hypothetical protein
MELSPVMPISCSVNQTLLDCHGQLYLYKNLTEKKSSAKKFSPCSEFLIQIRETKLLRGATQCSAVHLRRVNTNLELRRALCEVHAAAAVIADDDFPLPPLQPPPPPRCAR